MSTKLKAQEYQASNKINFRLSTLYDGLIFIDLAISVYFFFFNQYRTFSQGIWFVFAVQTVILPLLVTLAKISSRNEISEIKRVLVQKKVTKRKEALFSELGDTLSNVYVPKYENITKLMGLIIVLSIVIDSIITFNFVWVGAFIDSLPASRGSSIGEIYFIVALLNQVYFLAIIFAALLLQIIFSTKDRVGKMLFNHPEIDVEVRKSAITLYKLLPKNRKRGLMVIFVLMILAISGIGFAYFELDDNIDIVDIPKQTNLVGFDPYYLRKDNTNKIQYLVSANIQNEYDKSFQQITLIEIIPEKDRIFTINLQDLLYGRDSILDTAFFESHAYFLIFSPKPGVGYDYTLYHFDLDTKETEILSHTFLNVPYHIFNQEWARLNYVLVPFNGGVHLIQTDAPGIPEPWVTNVTSFSLDKTINIQQTQNLSVIDGITFEGKTYLLNFDPTSNFEYFGLSLAESVGMSLDWSSLTSTTMVTEYKENEEYVSPNGGSLQVVDNELLYRSYNNIYSITRDLSSKVKFSYIDQLRGFYPKTLRGMEKVDDMLIAPTERGITYLSYTDLSEIIEAKAVQNGYVSSYFGNTLYFEGEVYTANFDGKLFVWPGSPEEVRDHKNWVSQMVYLSLGTYALITVVFIYLKQKWVVN